MNSTTILGIAMISAGIILFAVSQLLLRRWIKNIMKSGWKELIQNDLPQLQMS